MNKHANQFDTELHPFIALLPVLSEHHQDSPSSQREIVKNFVP